MSLTTAALSITSLFESAEISWPTVQYLLGGVRETCLLVLGAMLLGLALGTAMASLQVYGPRWSGRLISVYVWFFRGVPILVLMFMFFFGLSTEVEKAIAYFFEAEVTISPFACAVTVLGLASTAYQSQIFRGAMLSIPAGQFKAALALGFSPRRAVTAIILPQALRLSIPAWSNEYSILLKDSAIAYVIGVSEIMSRFKAVASTNHKILLMYILAGVLYYLLTWAGVRFLRQIHRRTRLPGLVEAETGY